MAVPTIARLLFRQKQNCLVRITDQELLSLKLSAPVLLSPYPELLKHVDEARQALRAGAPGEYHHPLPMSIRELDAWMFYHLESYLEPKRAGHDRLYVLEFQGSRQYVMFGHTKNLMARVNFHRLAAHSHGFALLNAWASPGLTSAYRLEQVALQMAGDFHRHDRLGERFYDMPFEKGLAIARAVFECRSTLTTAAR